ncbi:MAG: transglycosylase domain-containing protein [Fibrobacteres bacterium]|nr:transglycosylase domain-containing protein [Fibrobacterota bacterium]
MATATEIRFADGPLLGRMWLEDRTPIERKDLPEHLIQALVATEDARFYDHSGIDFLAIPSALFQSLTGSKRGGSTLAQQLAKNLYQTRSNTGLLGQLRPLSAPIAKVKEWILATKLEFLHSKDQILVLYLNTVSFGNNSYGIHSAAWRYFGKRPSELELAESALLVAMLKGTAYYNPFNHPARAMDRRNTVFQRMAAVGAIAAPEADSLAKLPMGLHPRSANQSSGPAPHLRDWVSSFVRNFCRERDCDPETDGLVVHTTLDSRLQSHAMTATREWMPMLQTRFKQDWGASAPWRYSDGREIPGYLDSLCRLSPRWKPTLDSLASDTAAAYAAFARRQKLRVFNGNAYRDTVLSPRDSIAMERKLLQGSLVAIDPRDGKILAWVGGVDHRFSQLDHVAGTRRSPGSTAKPFVYCAALEKGMSPCERLVDSVRTFAYLEEGKKKYWTPHNADWLAGNDSITIRAGMARSLNTITSQLTLRVGPDSVASLMRRLGIKSPLKPVPSIGLGSNPMSLLELAGAYQAFVNGGSTAEPWAISRIETHDGKVLAQFHPSPRKVLAEDVSWLMTWMLRGGLQEPQGTSLALLSHDLFKGGRQLGGKTGTSSDHADGWYVAASPQIIAAAWTGNDDPSLHFRSGETGEGSRTGLPLVGRFLSRVFKDSTLDFPPVPFPDPPPSVKRRWNCPTPWPPKVDSLSDSAKAAKPFSLWGIFD